MARTMRMRGFNVLHPFGWDAFGLPAENAAIKNNVHPEKWTLDNIAHMKGQLQRLGISYAWDREIATCLPDYYRWNQWLFTRMFQRGLAYRQRSTVNWCETDQTVLANEQVVDGGCWRCGTPVTIRELEQWFLRITRVRRRAARRARRAEGLARESADDAAQLDRAIGRRARQVRGRRPTQGVGDRSIEVFTTRIDTIYGATFVLLAPEHPLVEQFAARVGRSGGVPRARRAFRAQDRTARMTGEVEKEGFDTGRTRDQSVHESAGAGLGRELRARRVRHGRGDGRARARPARLRVRAQVRPADRHGRASSPMATRRDASRSTEAASRRRRRSSRRGRTSGLGVRRRARTHDGRRRASAASAKAPCSTG